MTLAIVFIHAFPLDARMWEPQVRHFSRKRSVLAPDLPGFGSDHSRNEVLEMSAAADAVAHAIGEAGLASALVCGLSMGGYVALALWRQHPALVAGLVLANTRGDADDEAARERRRQLAARLLREGSGFLVESPPPLLSPGASVRRRAAVRRMIAAQPAVSIAAAALGMAARPDSTSMLAGISVPTLVITSSEDSLIPPAATQPLADDIPNARFEVIEGAGHLSNLESPARFNALLRAHLKRIEAIS